MAETRIETLKLATWQDDNPYYLIILADGHDAQVIDLGQSGWSATHANLMRAPGMWVLTRKEPLTFVLTVMVYDGEQPYYTARHIGKAGSGGSNEVIAYGIGKKQRNGEVLRLWILPNGMVCGGEDVDDLGVKLVEAMGPRR